MGFILGVDVGGVIIDRVNDNTDTSFMGQNYLQTTAVPGSFECLAELKNAGEIKIVSKCGENVQHKTLEWMKHHSFYEITGISSIDLHFCRERHEKGGLCDKLGITDFVDDRLEVLSYLNSRITKYLMNGQDKEMKKYEHTLPRVTVVTGWTDLKDKIFKKYEFVRT